MSDRSETKQSVDILRAIDSIVEEAYNRSGLDAFRRLDSVRLSDSVEFIRSKRSVPTWHCGPSVNLQGSLYISTSNLLSIANSLGLFEDLMSDDLVEAVKDFVSKACHGDFYGYEESLSNADNFYSGAFFGERPAAIWLLSSSFFGTYKDRFLYLLADNDNSIYGSYDDYYSHFFLVKMSTILESRISDNSRVKDIMSYLERDRSRLIQWFQLVDNNFMNAFEELDRRFDIFVSALYRV